VGEGEGDGAGDGEGEGCGTCEKARNKSPTVPEGAKGVGNRQEALSRKKEIRIAVLPLHSAVSLWLTERILFK
jgi:hypothetical protein